MPANHMPGQELVALRNIGKVFPNGVTALRDTSFAGDRPATHIVPILLGPARAACAAAQTLQRCGIFAPAIRPPTVPEGTARLRLSLTALHTDAQIDQLLHALNLLTRDGSS